MEGRDLKSVISGSGDIVVAMAGMLYTQSHSVGGEL